MKTAPLSPLLNTNRLAQALLVGERILNLNWGAVTRYPAVLVDKVLTTAITKVEDQGIKLRM
jgi:hypothetical protein